MKCSVFQIPCSIRPIIFLIVDCRVVFLCSRCPKTYRNCSVKKLPHHKSVHTPTWPSLEACLNIVVFKEISITPTFTLNIRGLKVFTEHRSVF